ncbi:MAG: hypothetical protein EA398_03965 [Deltaproteobacteria bacterium]|nr:MAG: hypothetical protein EA398_03965 [Deltaproteobacteria bacterium]
MRSSPVAFLAVASLLLFACEVLDDPPATDSGESVPSESGSTFVPVFPTDSGGVTVDSSLPPLVPDWDDAAVAEDFFAAPWPSDERVTERGTISMAGFPRSNRGLVADYRRVFEEEVRGFSGMPVLYVRIPGLAEALDTPPAPADSLRRRATVQLVELSRDRCGTLTPLEVIVRSRADRYAPADLLAASPVHGFPLRPATRYAFIVRAGLTADAGLRIARPAALQRRLDDADPEGDGPWDALVRCLDRASLAMEEVAVATVFTTGESAALLRTVRDFAMDPDQLDDPALLSLEQEEGLTRDGRVFHAGVVELPIFMRGTTPYGNSGGAIELDGEGRPIVQRLEEVAIGIMLPEGATNPPLLVWSDGTGATLRSPFNSRVIRELVEEGFAVLSWVPQFHDGRSGPGADPEISTFNFLNPEAGRTIFVQQAVEASLMLRVAAVLDGHPDIGPLDRSRPVFGGHSQGALIGALAAGVEDGYVAWGLHGVGGYLANTIIERKDPIDFTALIGNILNVGGPLDRFHPVVHLAQLGSDPVDPGNYAALWRGTPERPAGTHVYIINGLLDDAVPFRSADHLALAGDLPLLQPAGWDPDPFGVWSTRTHRGTASGNQEAVDGTPLTLATWLDEREGHFTIYRQAGVRRSFIRFLVSAREGVPEIPIPER